MNRERCRGRAPWLEFRRKSQLRLSLTVPYGGSAIRLILCPPVPDIGVRLAAALGSVQLGSVGVLFHFPHFRGAVSELDWTGPFPGANDGSLII